MEINVKNTNWYVLLIIFGAIRAQQVEVLKSHLVNLHLSVGSIYKIKFIACKKREKNRINLGV